MSGIDHYARAVQSPGGLVGDQLLARRLDSGTATEQDLELICRELIEAVRGENGRKLSGLRGEYIFSGPRQALTELFCYLADGASKGSVGDPKALMRKMAGVGAPSRRNALGANLAQAERMSEVITELERACEQSHGVKYTSHSERMTATLLRYGYVHAGQHGIEPDELAPRMNAAKDMVITAKQLAQMTSKILRDMREGLQTRGLVPPLTARGNMMREFDLQGWKDIADYLGKWAQRSPEYWSRNHKRLGLPVVSFLGNKCANSGDIDRWMRSQFQSDDAPGEHP